MPQKRQSYNTAITEKNRLKKKHLEAAKHTEDSEVRFEGPFCGDCQREKSLDKLVSDGVSLLFPGAFLLA